jgi:hypothetical protein
VIGFGAFFVTAVVVVGAALGGAGLAFAYLCPVASGVFAGWVLGRRGHRWTGFAISYLLAYGIGLLLWEWIVNGITDATEPPPFVPDFRPLIVVLAAFAVTYLLVRGGSRGEGSGTPSHSD